MHSIEKNIPLKESRIWQAQRDFYSENGIDAWKNQVPFFVTSNPFIANCYAQLIKAYVRDLIATGQINHSEPIYIFELGTGSGQFSFYCLKALTQELPDVSFCYVMTDFTESNIAFWEEQEVFKGLCVDFAVFDLEHPEPIYLLKQQITLKTLKNPCILIANYIFDSVRQNFYAIEQGVLFEKRIETFIPLEEYDQAQDKILSLDNIKVSDRSVLYAWDEVPIDEEPYLRFYERHLKQGQFSLPIAGFSALDFMRTLSPSGMMLISSDKGYNTLQEIEKQSPLEIITHGSVSLDVNFHALALYFAFLEGQSKLQSYHEGIRSNVFVLGTEKTPNLDSAYVLHCETSSPADYFHIHRKFRDLSFDLQAMLAQLQLGQYDPYVFALYINQICDAVGNAPASLIEEYMQIIPELAENIYPLPSGIDHYFNFGRFLHALRRYDEAIFYFERSARRYGHEPPETLRALLQSCYKARSTTGTGSV